MSHVTCAAMSRGEPRNVFQDCARTSEGMLGVSNMETDRPLEIGNLRKFDARGAKFPQIANLPCSACHRDMAPTAANFAISSLETKLSTWTSVLGLESVIGGLDKHSGAWTSLGTLNKNSGA